MTPALRALPIVIKEGMALLVRAIRKVVGVTRRTFGPEPAWRRHKRTIDHAFDSAHDVDTGGITQLKAVGVPRSRWRESVPHIAVDPGEFKAALSAIEVDLSRFTFIDLGSGKGRALLLAAHYPFRRIIGVEFAEPLVATARENLRRASTTHDVSRIDVIHSDVLKYEFPNDPVLIFMYNPFGDATMREVARRARASLDSSAREMLVLYLNPFQMDAWRDAGFTLINQGPHFVILECKGEQLP